MKLIASFVCFVLLSHSIYCWFDSEAETTTSTTVAPPTTEQPTTQPPSTTVAPEPTAAPVAAEVHQTAEKTEESVPEGAVLEGAEEAKNASEPNPLDGVDFYLYSVMDMTNQEYSLEAYRGYVTLVVNVASKCGYTDSTYKDLVALQTKFEPTGAFTVLAFPCNQFWEQEPGTNEEILRFAAETYNVTFPMFGKTHVTGDNATPAYQYLAQATGYAPQWNFWKYLVDHTGHVVDVWSHETPAVELEGWIEDAVNKALGNTSEFDGATNETEHQDHDHSEL